MLFSSFDPHHLDLSRSASVGLADLRSYMEMAERHSDDPGVLRPAITRDLHHDEVVSALEEAGLHVRRDVGLSEFRIDVAVAAREEGPWVAVFLDGPAYAARDGRRPREPAPTGCSPPRWAGAASSACGSRNWRDRGEVIARLVLAANEPVPEVAQEPVAAPAEPVVPLRAAAVPAPTPRIEHPTFVAADDGLSGEPRAGGPAD